MNVIAERILVAACIPILTRIITIMRRKNIMTSSANDEWDYYALKDGLSSLEGRRRELIKLLGTNTSEQVRNIEHTIAFIEYNMREMEIIGGNGD